MNTNLDIKWLIIIALGVYILFLQQCGGKKEICPEVSVTTKVDTLRIKGKTDTIKITVKEPIYIPIEIPTPVTVTVPSDSGDITVHEYSSEIRDSLIEGTITSQVDGKLIAQNFKYKPLFPKYITRTDTIVIDKTETSVLKRNYIGLGAEIGGSATSVNVSPKLSLITRKGYTYSYRYGLMDKTHNISIVRHFNLKELFDRKKLAKVVN
jgi:hypothetical protein